MSDQQPIRYIVGHGWAERVSDRTALPHHTLYIDQAGDVTVRVDRRQLGESKPVLQIGRAEMVLLAREARRAARRRFWARLGIR